MAGGRQRRPISGYFKFAAEVRDDVKRVLQRRLGRQPDVVEVARETGRRWRGLTLGEKNRYNRR